MYCNVLVVRPFDFTFTYALQKDQKIRVGSVVNIPFGKKNDEIGLVYELKDKLDNNDIHKIKQINFIYNDIIFSKNIINFIDWISNYTLAPKGLVLKLFLPNKDIISYKLINQNKNLYNYKSIKLNGDQKKAYQVIKKSLFKYSPPLVLEGVTGSGKTEVYFEIIENVIKKNKQVLIMIPEISLTPQLELRFLKRFGISPDIWHSKVSNKNKKKTWQKCFRGDSMIVLGARSSLFLPFSNLSLIVVDEEHDLSFKQEDNIRYQARDLAIVRAKIEKIPIILSSATPSLETQNNINKKKFNHAYLPSQFSGIELPEIILVDLNKETLCKNKWISKLISNEIKSCVESGDQTLLFLNRRGYSPLSLCSDCGYRFQCENCSSCLVMHRNKKRLQCHHCGFSHELDNVCPKCQKKETIKFIGPGVERVADEVKQLFPQYTVAMMSSDNVNTTKKLKKMVNDYQSGKIDILVATQIMSKGYHFPNLSLVGIIDADSGLVGGDIKAIERTYNLLEQVGGRAGRSKKLGRVILQTYFPNQPIIQSLIKRDRKEFIENCLSERKVFDIPPYSFMTAIIISSSSKTRAEIYSKNLTKTKTLDSNITILGPVEAPMFLLRGKYRYRILLKGKNRRSLNKFTRILIEKCPPPSNLRLTIDVDPYTFV